MANNQSGERQERIARLIGRATFFADVGVDLAKPGVLPKLLRDLAAALEEAITPQAWHAQDGFDDGALITRLRQPVDYGGYDGHGPDGLHVAAADRIEDLLVRLTTEQEMHAAWRKRAEEAEAITPPAAPVERPIAQEVAHEIYDIIARDDFNPDHAIDIRKAVERGLEAAELVAARAEDQQRLFHYEGLIDQRVRIAELERERDDESGTLAHYDVPLHSPPGGSLLTTAQRIEAVARDRDRLRYELHNTKAKVAELEQQVSEARAEIERLDHAWDDEHVAHERTARKLHALREGLRP